MNRISVGGLPDFVDGADVGMFERGRRSGFEHESPLGVLAPSEVWRKELQRNRAAQAFVPGAVHHAHAAAPESLSDGVVGDHPPLRRRGSGADRAHGRRDDRVGEPVERARAIVRFEERSDFIPKVGIVSTLAREQGGAAGGVQVHRGCEERTRAAPSHAGGRCLVRRGLRWSAHAPTSRLSHARAIAHSRFTVAGEMPSASAVSSIVIPP